MMWAAGPSAGGSSRQSVPAFPEIASHHRPLLVAAPGCRSFQIEHHAAMVASTCRCGSASSGPLPVLAKAPSAWSARRILLWIIRTKT